MPCAPRETDGKGGTTPAVRPHRVSAQSVGSLRDRAMTLDTSSREDMRSTSLSTIEDTRSALRAGWGAGDALR